MNHNDPCPCGRTQAAPGKSAKAAALSYEECCGRYLDHGDDAAAPDAEAGPPMPEEFPELKFPDLQRATLSNGTRVILAERSLRIGDLVRVDNFEGQVTDIKTRYTLLRAPNGRESIVPNEILITQRVENASLADRSLLLSSVVQVAYGCDVGAVMAALKSTVAEVPRVVSEPAPNVHLTAFAADGLELTLSFWISDPENGQMSVRSAVNLAVLQTLNKMGVEIPFPQRVVHLVQPS